jgi:hypothetical protein
LAVSYGGGDCTPSYHHEAYPTQEQAIAKALSREARWHREEYTQEDTDKAARFPKQKKKVSEKPGRSH